ncbi:metallophosphoesterase [Candidatus Woesearchaeota archaeon]|nr:metallophosphoesterase [Candidatus Woesearchaeota archaeon]
MRILPKIRIIDLALYLEESGTLIIGDVHLGFEESMNKMGVLIPRFQFKDTLSRLEKIFNDLGKEPDAVVINGDLKHEFGEISDQEWREILKFIDFLLIHSKKIIIVKGNHDVILYPVARKKNIEIHETHFINNICISHGHTIPKNLDFEKSEIIIIGDEHPAVTLKEGGRAELYKCFLKGEWKGKKIIVMPSFNQVTVGKDILKEQFLSPFIQRNAVYGYEIYIVGSDRVYDFGKVKNLRNVSIT